MTTNVRAPFAALVLAMLPAVLDQTILATGLPTIAADLGRLTDVSWVVTAYVVAATASTPLWGKLGDRHGPKRMLEIALLIFLAGSAACGAAANITELVVLRGLQGIGAGGLMTLAMAAVGGLVAPRERGRYQGYIAAAFAAATIVGPLIGGLLVQHVSWRWVFFVNLPLGGVALAGLALTLPAPESGRPARKLDLAGAALLAGATVALMLVCVWGGERYAWDSAPVIVLALVAVAAAAGLVVRERAAADPIVPLGMLRTRAVGVASGSLFLGTAALFAVTVFVPLFLQVTTGASPTQAGLLLVPMMAGITVSTTLSGRWMTRSGRYKRLPLTGLGLMSAALILLGALAANPSRTATGIAIAIFGLGFGMVTQVLVVAVQNSVERGELGVATATTGFFRALGGAVGAAALGAVFAGQAGLHVSSLHVSGAARAGVISGFEAVCFVAAAVAALAFAVTLRLPELPLQTGAPRPGEQRPAQRVAAGSR